MKPSYVQMGEINFQLSVSGRIENVGWSICIGTDLPFGKQLLEYSYTQWLSDCYCGIISACNLVDLDGATQGNQWSGTKVMRAFSMALQLSPYCSNQVC